MFGENMSTRDYVIDCGFDSLRVRADLDQLNSPILLVNMENGEAVTEATVYRTADAGQDERRMAKLAIHAAGREWWKAPDVDVPPEDEDDYIDGLIRSIRLA